MFFCRGEVEEEEILYSVHAISPSQCNLSLSRNTDCTEELADRGYKASQWGALLRLKAPLISFMEAFILSDVTEQVT